MASALVTCTLVNELRPLPRLKVVKSCPSGAARQGDLFQPRNGAADVGSALACGAESTTDLTPDVPFSITEAAAGTTVLADYSRSTTGTCSGTPKRGDALVTCTLVNELRPLPRLKVVKSCPSGAARQGDLFQPRNGAADVGSALACGAESTTDLTPDVPFSITEAAAGTTVLADYSHSTTGTCSGTPKRGDALVTCTLVNELRPLPRLKVVKSCPSGAARQGDLFQPRNGAADVGSALACGAESTTDLTPDVPFSITEAAAGTTVLADYSRSTTGTCSGTPKRGDALVTCTLVNELRPLPRLKVVKSCPSGAARQGDLFQPRNGAADVGSALACGAESTTDLTPDVPFSITEAAAGTTVLADYSRSTTGTCSGTPKRGDALVTCTLVNELRPLPRLKVVKSCPSGAARQGDLFQPRNGAADVGSALACGAESTTDLTPDVPFSITEAAAGTTVLADYSRSTTGTCSGTPKRGDALVTCTLVNELNPRLTVTKIVTGGSKTSSQFTMNVKRGDVTLGTFAGDAQGTTRAYTPGGYVVSEDVDPLYAVSFEGDCEGTLAYGDVKSCTVRNTRKARSITVEKSVSATPGGTYVKSPDKATKPENGGTFYFRVAITNTSAADTITVTDLTDIIEPGETVGSDDLDNLVCGTPETGDGIPFRWGPVRQSRARSRVIWKAKPVRRRRIMSTSPGRTRRARRRSPSRATTRSSHSLT